MNFFFPPSISLIGSDGKEALKERRIQRVAGGNYACPQEETDALVKEFMSDPEVQAAPDRRRKDIDDYCKEAVERYNLAGTGVRFSPDLLKPQGFPNAGENVFVSLDTDISSIGGLTLPPKTGPLVIRK